MSAAYPHLAKGPLGMPHSGIREIINIALGMPGAIRLEVGEPDFMTPAYITEAAAEFVRRGSVRYVGTAGTPSLRDKLCNKLKTVNAITATPDQINVGVGGIGVIAAAFAALIEPGDEVLLPDPAWPCYELMLAVTGGVKVGYACPPEAGFLPDTAQIEALITDRTKLIVLNSPSNPTGAVFPRAMIEAIAGIADRRGVYLLSDECYDEVVFEEGAHLSPASFAGTDRVITVMSFSKTYAMTGWRVGYMVSSPDFADTVNKIHESNISCVSAVSQFAAEAALDGPREPRNEMVAAYRRRRDLCVDLLEGHGLLINRPAGAFYIMADISRSGLGSRRFAFDLIETQGVAVAPGSAFGQRADGSVRISLASSEDALREGIGRLADHVSACATKAGGR